MRLAVFTVKKFILCKGKYYTYGGFGKSTVSYLDNCSSLIVYGHVQISDFVPEGWYLFEHKSIEIRHLIPSTNLIYQNLGFLVDFFRLFRFPQDFDVAECRVPDFTGIIGALYCVLIKKPYYIQIVADWRIERQKTPFFKKKGAGMLLKLFYLFYEFCEKAVSRRRLIFAQGSSSFARYRDIGECVEYVSSTITRGDITSPRSLSSDGKLRLVHVARLTGVKNQIFLVKFAKYLISSGFTDFEINIAGDGPLENELMRAVEKEGLRGHVFFKGRLNPGPELDSFYNSADIFILCSHSEGTPKVLLEAMAKGLPVICSDVGGVSTVVKGDCGYLYQPDNPADCKKGLERITENYAAFSESAVRTAAMYTVESLNRLKFDMVSRLYEK